MPLGQELLHPGDAAALAELLAQVRAEDGEVTLTRTDGRWYGHALAGPDCGRGNVVKSVVPTHEAGPAGSGNFTYVVTVVASPL